MHIDDFTAGVIAATLAHRQKYLADKQVADFDVLSSQNPNVSRTAIEEELQLDEADSEFPVDCDESTFWGSLADSIEASGVKKAVPSGAMGVPFLTLSKVNKDEPFFVLRAQDITASVVVNGWIEMQKLRPETAEGDNSHKIGSAVTIADRMEQYEGQKWAD